MHHRFPLDVVPIVFKLQLASTFALMPRSKRSVIGNAKWERFEPLIRQLYLQDDKTLPEVLEELRAHDFDPRCVFS